MHISSFVFSPPPFRIVCYMLWWLVEGTLVKMEMARMAKNVKPFL